MTGKGKTIFGGIVAGLGAILTFIPGCSVIGLAAAGLGTTLLSTGCNEMKTDKMLKKQETGALEKTNLASKAEFVGMLTQAATGTTYLRAGIRKVKNQHQQFTRFGIDGSKYVSAKAHLEKASMARGSYPQGSVAPA